MPDQHNPQLNHSAIPTVTYHCLLPSISLPFAFLHTIKEKKTQLQSRRGRRKTKKESSFSAESELRRRRSQMNLQSWEDDEEKERLIKVVEYLEPLMSKELLCKFPDNSAFDFDYSQSTIWSPLVPRPYHSMDLDVITPIKLPSDSEMASEKTTAEKNSLKKATSNLKKKLLSNGFSIRFGISKSNRKMKRMKKKKMASDFSPTPLQAGACYPNNKRGWSKLLKAATKHFKKKKKDPASQMKLYF